MSARTVVRAVVDSNLLVSGILGRRPRSHAGRLHRAILVRRFQLVISDYILREVRDVLLSPEIQETGAPPEHVVDRIVAALRLTGQVVPGSFEGDFAPNNPKDSPIVACALEGDAGYVVTDDRALLDLGARRLAAFRPVRIVYAKKFLELLDRGDA
ncbi:MAG: putative toxin-antitoxin system toxin component, PIN family [Deltaproteobacteria bacterium]|nr:putative toxin-antitoxin system toxin component, PIN family [Deltaproteobacteria bacterium]